ncbi:HAD hydrolase-like protein [Helicobacter sp. NHP22-001]|uniref:HAD hydrolase-like protein n=1 Tax=Helicobacter sp. NHP22-001 TaxID=3040202 RepID=UPI0033225AF7
MSKASGNLYKQVLQDLQIQASQILHIGDNAHSDHNKAQESGLQIFFIQYAGFLGVGLPSISRNMPCKIPLRISFLLHETGIFSKLIFDKWVGKVFQLRNWLDCFNELDFSILQEIFCTDL